MTIKRFRHQAKPSKGITLIEILIVLGVLAVLMSFTMPSVSKAAIKAEVSAAVENMQFSLQMARTVSRASESALVMHISPALGDVAQTISFTSPDGERAYQPLQIQDFTMPANIVLVSESDSFVFDGSGQVQNPGRVSLVSRGDEFVSATIDVF